jgi:hypothetical protein
MLQIETRDLGQVYRHLVKRKPSNLRTFLRFLNVRFAGHNCADKRRRNPMLAFGRKDMVDHIQELADRNFNAKFLADLTCERLA